jgi:PAS domain S-box-containing protein
MLHERGCTRVVVTDARARDDAQVSFFEGEGRVRALARSFDWGRTPVGPFSTWSASLRMAVRLCLECGTPMALWMGEDLTLIPNEAYVGVLRERFPSALGRSLREIWPEYWRDAERAFRSVLAGHSVRVDEARFTIVRDGRQAETFFAYSLSPLRDVCGRVIGVFNVMEETTPLVRARAEWERHYRFLFDRIQEGFCVLEPVVDAHGTTRDHHFLETNSSFHRLTGIESDEGRTARELLPELQPLWDEVVPRVTETGELSRIETSVPRLGRWLEVLAFRIEDEPPRLALLFNDITARKESENALRSAVARYEEQVRLFESVTATTPDFVYVYDREGHFVYVNRSLLEVWGMECKEALGKTCLEIGYEQWHHDLHMRDIAQVIETKRPMKGEVEFKAPRTGVPGVYEYIFTPVIGSSGEVELIASITRDITAQKQNQRALEEANARLREADRQKDHFLAVLSHELRNPLTPIENALHLLDRAAPGSDQANRAKRVIERQVDQLSHLVNDLLDVTRITRGKIQLRRRRIELNQLVSRTVDDHRALYEAAGIALELKLEARPIVINADWRRIAQILGNLLQNSAKFTKPGGRVTVTASSDAASGEAQLQVADTGSGIPPALLSRLFQPFMQADETLDRSQGGLGLGLALVRGLVEEHGGTIEAKSAGVGCGSEFVIRLPLASGTPAALDEGLEPAPTRPQRVLVIEDNVDSAETLKEVLQLQGHEVLVAYDGPSGVSLARRSHPDVTLCDIGLPGMDGYEVARAFRADPALRRVRLVALSGYALPRDLRRAAEAGFERHLAKPASLEQLQALLAEAPGGDAGPLR